MPGAAYVSTLLLEVSGDTRHHSYGGRTLKTQQGMFVLTQGIYFFAFSLFFSSILSPSSEKPVSVGTASYTVLDLQNLTLCLVL